MRSLIARSSLPAALLVLTTVGSTASAGIAVRTPEAAVYAHASSSGGTAQQQSAMGSHLETAWNSPLVQAVSSGTDSTSPGSGAAPRVRCRVSP
jgi:hypothetical protein